MADERRISLPHRRAAAHEYYAVGKPSEHLFGMLLRADFADGAVLLGEGRDGGDGRGPGNDDMAARHLEKARDIRNVFAALVGLFMVGLGRFLREGDARLG
jgi:hypothetical protein